MSRRPPSAGLSHDLIAEAVAWRHQLHEHPELAFQEFKTADFIASQLSQFGFAVHRGLAGTGVVGTLTRGTSRRSIGIRADMDALPIQEQSGAAHASRVSGVMHACGHDGHVAIALGAARACARLPDLDGTVHFIFQPAEENEGGGRRMVEEGLFRRFPCKAVYALHNWPGLPLGTCVARDGPMMAALAVFEIVLVGRGSHGAMPHEARDPIIAGCHLVSALQTIVSRSVDPLEAAVVSVTQIRAGKTWNVIPDELLIRGTTRWFSDRVGAILEERIADLTKIGGSAMGCDAQVRYEKRFPATINECAAAAFIRQVAAAPPLSLKVLESEPSMASEDFAYMLCEVPGCYFWLGAGAPNHSHGLHSARYDFNDNLLPAGIELWTTVVKKCVGSTQP